MAVAHMNEHHVPDWVEPAARVGYIAKAIVFFLVGGIAFQVAIGEEQQAEGAKGALERLAGEPYGAVLLGAIAIGLFAYAFWRWTEAITDAEHDGSSGKGLMKRAGYAISGTTYGLLGVAAAELLYRASASSGNQTEDWTAKLMAQPFGQWLVGIAGAIVIGVGIHHCVKAYKASFQKYMKTREMDNKTQKWTERAGRWGYSARGVVDFIIGGLLIYAAYTANPQNAAGAGEALNTLKQQAYGPWLLGLVGVGFIAYGVYCLVESRYRKVDEDPA